VPAESLPGAGPLVLIHIPRTAGTTLAMILRHHYRGGGFTGGGNVFARGDAIESRLRKAGTKERIRAIAGHLTYGLRGALPEGARFVTILRDPVERTLSHYHVLPRSRPDRKQTGLVPPWLPPPRQGQSLAEALDEGYVLDNLQTRMLCGLVSPFDELPADALERAKANVRDGIEFVGTTERFDELLALLNLALGWPTMPYGRSRAYGRRPEELPADVRRLVEERNELDRELHLFADELLTEHVSARTDFQEELEVLREATRRWNGGDPSPSPHEKRVTLALREAEAARAAVQERRRVKKARVR
jgi:hypothetical protein